mgnify:CR=1 FL=1
MPDKHDIVESALQSLAGQRWPGANHNSQLESKLMQAFDKQKSKNIITRHPLIAACLAVLVLGSFGFAAAGGVEMVKSWFILNVEIDGIQDFNEAFDGPVNITLTTDENGTQRVYLTDANGDPLTMADLEVKNEVIEGDTCTITVGQAAPAQTEEDEE